MVVKSGNYAAKGVLSVMQSTNGNAKTLYRFDLTYTLKLNRDNPEDCRTIWDHAHFVSSLQGLVNREEPRLYLFFVGGTEAKSDHFWMAKFQEPGEWLADYRLQEIPDMAALVEQFPGSIEGLVVYDGAVASTSNVASTIAGVENLACVRYDEAPSSLYTWLTSDDNGPKLPVKVRLLNDDGASMFTGEGTIPGSDTPSTGSAKCDAYIWAKEQYLDTGKCNPVKMAYYLDSYWIDHPGGYVPNHTVSNHDYFIANRGFFFDLAPYDDETPIDDPNQPVGADTRTMQAILRSAWERVEGKSMIHAGGFVPWDKKYTSEAGGGHGPVDAEWRYAEILSCFNAYMDADAIGYCSMANASVFQHFQLAEKYPQTLPTVDDLKAKGLILPDGRIADKNYITLYIGDYDAAAWLYNAMPHIWEDSTRGEFPIAWGFNPNLSERFAAGMDYFRRSATQNDMFIAGDCGAGYVNPGHLVEPRRFSGLPSGLQTWTEHCRWWYEKFDLSLTGFIIDGFAPEMTEEARDAYTAFSPDGMIYQHSDLAGLYKGEFPYVKMTWDVYDPKDGAEIMLRNLTQNRPEFFSYRTILWTPTNLKKMMDLVKADRKARDVEFVDPHSMMLLVKQHFGG